MRYLLLLLIMINSLNGLSNHVKQGQILFTNLYTAKDIQDSVTLQSVIDIMHYVYAQVPAKNNGKGFLSGNIIIEDPGYKLFNYLRSYVKTQFAGDMCKENHVSKYYAYPRTSSHFNAYYVHTKKAQRNWFASVTKTSCDYIHYGIDVTGGYTLPISKKRHILFGKIGKIHGKQFMFVKFEEAGMHGAQIIQHMFNLIKKYISENSNPSPTDYRREDVPKNIMKKFTKLINSFALNLSQKQRYKIMQKVKAYGIRAMIKTAQSYSKYVQLNTFASKLQDRYPDWRYRFGNEIILMHDELM